MNVSIFGGGGGLELLVSQEQPRPIQLHKTSHITALRLRFTLPDTKPSQEAGPTPAEVA